MANKPRSSEAEKRFQQYFAAMASKYNYWTGNITRDLLLQYLEEYGSHLGINKTSKIHDNAAGPGTASEALLKWLGDSPSIIATDSVPAMIEALNEIKAKEPTWQSVTTQVVDSHHMPFEDLTFDFSFVNFSVFVLSEPVAALKEAHRTLKNNGTAIITTWKRFGVFSVVRAAQKAIKGADYESAFQPAGNEFLQEGYLSKIVEEAGWQKSEIETLSFSKAVTDPEDLKGLTDFMTGRFTATARAGWTDEENGKWAKAVTAEVEKEKVAHGGLLMEAWVVVARKGVEDSA
jgi:ubiquinone/menaquinone biosynthesis C-methylase UbiE